MKEPIPDSSKWKNVWTWEGPQRVRCSLWLLYNNGLKTIERRLRCGLNANPLCPLCSTYVESSDHLLYICVVVKQVWKALYPRGIPQSFVQGSFKNWLSSNLDAKITCNDKDWCLTFGIGLWSIWYHRNQHIFCGKNFIPSKLVNQVQYMKMEVECGRQGVPHRSRNHSEQLIG